MEYNGNVGNLNIDPKEIFICYRGASDQAITVGMELYYLLEKLNNVPCFFAPRVIPKGADYKNPLKDYFRSVKVVVVLLTPGFFDGCADKNDVVLNELNIAFANRRMKFYPIIFNGFGQTDYDTALQCFNAKDINRLKHINAPLYNGPYGGRFEDVAHKIIQLKDAPVEDDIRDELKALGEVETSREYDLNITELAVQYSMDKDSAAALISIIENDSQEFVAYNAYYCLNVMYRRTKDNEDLRRLVDKYHDRFKSHRTANHLLALYYISLDENKRYNEILEMVQYDAENLTENSGYIHMFPFVVASFYEDDVPEDKEKYVEKWYRPALQAVEAAIAISPDYAKFYCTKARILAMGKEYKEAEKYVARAISLENSKRSDYFLRLTDYQYYKIMIKTEQRIYELLKGGKDLDRV